MKPKRHRFPSDLQDDLSIFCFKLRNEHHLTLQHIGRIIDRNHATVIYHIEKCKNLQDVDRKFRLTAENFTEESFAEKLKKYNIEPFEYLTQTNTQCQTT